MEHETFEQKTRQYIHDEYPSRNGCAVLFWIALVVTLFVLSITSVRSQNINLLDMPEGYAEAKTMSYDYHKRDHSNSWRVAGLFAASIILDAVGDGLNDDGDKVWGHALNATSKGLLIASPFIVDIDRSKWHYYAASYITMRMALFDPVYNTTRGLDIGYIGNSSVWDKGMQKFNPPPGAQLWGRGVMMGFSLTMTFKLL